MSYLDVIAGDITQKQANTVSLGVADADKLIELSPSGKLDSSMYVLNTSTGDVHDTFKSVGTFVEGDLVNIYPISGVSNIRLADKTLGFEAHGVYMSDNGTDFIVSFSPAFVRSSDFSPAIVLGAEYYLGIAGAITTTPSTTPGEISQKIGIGIASDILGFKPKDFKVIA